MPRFQTLFAALAVVLCESFVASAAPLPYQLNVVAQTGGGTFTQFAIPSLNALGVAAFRGNNSAGNGGVFYGAPGAVQQLATPGLNVTPLFGGFAFGDLVAINNSARLAFTAVPPNSGGLEGTQGVYTTVPGGPIQTVLAPFTVAGDISRGPTMNQPGAIVVVTGHSPDEVYRGDAVTPAVRTFQTLAQVSTAHLNDGGHVTFTTVAVNGDRNLYYDNAAVVTPATVFTDSGSPTQSGFLLPYQSDVANDNRVVFSANFDGLDTSLFTWTDGTIARVPGAGGIGIAVPAINNLGGVAALSGVYFGRPKRLSFFADGAEDPVISVGDALLGSTVTDLAFVAEGFNDAGQIAFLAQLADGREAILLATPVPEPASAAALATVGTFLLRRGRRVARRGPRT